MPNHRRTFRQFGIHNIRAPLSGQVARLWSLRCPLAANRHRKHVGRTSLDVRPFWGNMETLLEAYRKGLLRQTWGENGKTLGGFVDLLGVVMVFLGFYGLLFV